MIKGLLACLPLRVAHLDFCNFALYVTMIYKHQNNYQLCDVCWLLDVRLTVNLYCKILAKGLLGQRDLDPRNPFPFSNGPSYSPWEKNDGKWWRAQLIEGHVVVHVPSTVFMPCHVGNSLFNVPGNYELGAHLWLQNLERLLHQFVDLDGFGQF
jgi:hypothetical protein